MANMRASLWLGVALAALVMLAQVDAQSKPPSPRPPAPKPPAAPPTAFRLVSTTKWNTTANITALQKAEETVARACKAFLLQGITGYSLDKRTDILWGSHVKVFDFKTPAHYANYSVCVAAQPGRAISQPWETWKNRVLFPYFGSLAAAAGGVRWSATIANVTNIPFALGNFTDFNTQVASLLSVAQAGANVNGTVSAALDVAHVLSTRKPQGILGVNAYANEGSAGGLPPLDTITKITPLLKVARRIQFIPIVI
ncbi:hypothetical protein HYH03_012841 [Edaphochlamys debaryana]|uniref:Uncharacterized protein n=1 Tax=Edaphochlamys debaryana TaxID=47281 RepID=A0A835XR13_9CHLO|nr:hypothetical protein HYH03_012841 [Edaphochlamys debaryana]|eukprot:KAG2488521.1 hypothetical protein HYH03_012841 [Edaphochlamys debaryana]